MNRVIAWLVGLIRRPRVLALVIVAGLAWTGIKSCGVYVGPNKVAIRQVYFGSSGGIRKQPLWAGYHLVLRGAERLHVFPTDLQLLEMTVTEAALDHRSTGPIRIQTSDGYAVTLDVTVAYRIVDPYVVLTKVGPGRQYEDSVVIPRSDLVLRKTLGDLNTEEFYDAAKRVARVAEATRQLRAEFADKGIELVKVLVRRVTYDEEYQRQIEQRKIQDQAVFMNQAEAKAAKEEARKREIVATGEASVRVEQERGKMEAAKIVADAALYARQKAAEADLLVKTATARGTELENEALRAGGAENMVGLKMAEALEGMRVIVLPAGPGGLNPFNLRSLLDQFDVK